MTKTDAIDIALSTLNSKAGLGLSQSSANGENVGFSMLSM